MILRNNRVYQNMNKIPYYNKKYAWDYAPIGGLDCASYPTCEANPNLHPHPHPNPNLTVTGLTRAAFVVFSCSP